MSNIHMAPFGKKRVPILYCNFMNIESCEGTWVHFRSPVYTWNPIPGSWKNTTFIVGCGNAGTDQQKHLLRWASSRVSTSPLVWDIKAITCVLEMILPAPTRQTLDLKIPGYFHLPECRCVLFSMCSVCFAELYHNMKTWASFMYLHVLTGDPALGKIRRISEPLLSVTCA